MQEKGFDVLAIDISEEACEIMKKRGVKKVKCIDFFEFNEDEYDIKYMQMNEESGRYYGEVRYRTIYNDTEGEIFNWLYLDFNTLKDYTSRAGLDCEMLEKDDAGNYLTRLKRK